MNYLVKVRGLLNYALYILINLFLPPIGKTNPHSVLIIRLDGIGDYLLFRNFLSSLKTSSKYSEHKITLCGNTIWKDLAEDLDKSFVDNFIWLDRDKFYNNVFYKYLLLKKIKKNGYEIAISATYSREILFDDLIINSSNAKIKIGSVGSRDTYVKWKRKFFTDKYYTKLIPAPDESTFEFYRNKLFFENLICEKINIKGLQITTSDINPDFLPPAPYIVIFHGASRPEKIWNYENFCEVSKFLVSEYSFNIALVGSSKELEASNKISGNLPPKNIFNLTSKTSLTDLVKIIANSEFLISNDSAAVHLAAGLNKKFICLSNGERFGRFHPYPKDICDKGHYIYPPEIMNNINNTEMLKEKYRFDSDLDINEIKPEAVKNLLAEILK
jgi:ADP-heptose:LPS heptosyltransferase